MPLDAPGVRDMRTLSPLCHPRPHAVGLISFPACRLCSKMGHRAEWPCDCRNHAMEGRSWSHTSSPVLWKLDGVCRSTGSAGAGRWARQEGGEGGGSDPPLSLLAPGKILKHAKFNSHISFFTSFASEIPSLWDSHWSRGPYLSPHGHRELLSLSMPLSPFSSRERSLGSGELGGMNE